MDTKNLEFYYQYENEINRSAKLRESVISHVDSEVGKACEQIDGVELIPTKLNSGKTQRYYQSKKNKDLMFTIQFGMLLKKERVLMIRIELKDDLLKQKDKLRSIEFNEEERELLVGTFYTTNESWAFFASKKIVLSDKEIANLCESIVNEISDSPILRIYKKIETALVKL